MIPQMSSRWAPVAVLGGLLIVAAFLVVILPGGHEEASSLPLDGVSLDELAGNGIHVSAPAQGYVPGIGVDDAKKAASAVFPAVSVKQVVLAHVTFDATGVAAGPRHAWIVNFDVADPDLPLLGMDAATTVFAVAFIDADSGRFLDSIAEGAPVPSGAPHEGISGLTPGVISTPDTPNALATPEPDL